MLFRVDMWVSLATDLNTYDFMEFLYYKQIDAYHIFIDFKTAFDSTDRSYQFDAMSKLGIPAKLIRLWRMCLSTTISSV